MSSQAPKHAGETLPDHTQAFGRGETVMADLVAPNDVRWRGSALTPHALAPGEELGYLVRHRIFACPPGVHRLLLLRALTRTEIPACRLRIDTRFHRGIPKHPAVIIRFH